MSNSLKTLCAGYGQRGHGNTSVKHITESNRHLQMSQKTLLLHVCIWVWRAGVVGHLKINEVGQGREIHIRKTDMGKSSDIPDLENRVTILQGERNQSGKDKEQEWRKMIDNDLKTASKKEATQFLGEKKQHRPGFSLSLRYGTSLYSLRTNSQSKSGMVRFAKVPKHSITNSSSSSFEIWAARSPT